MDAMKLLNIPEVKYIGPRLGVSTARTVPAFVCVPILEHGESSNAAVDAGSQEIMGEV
jgi:hypothetical protein